MKQFKLIIYIYIPNYAITKLSFYFVIILLHWENKCYITMLVRNHCYGESNHKITRTQNITQVLVFASEPQIGNPSYCMYWRQFSLQIASTTQSSRVQIRSGWGEERAKLEAPIFFDNKGELLEDYLELMCKKSGQQENMVWRVLQTLWRTMCSKILVK